MKGRTLPRVYTQPLAGRRSGAGCVPGCSCGLTPETSRGFEVIGWARRLGVRLRRWQRWLLVHGLELDHEKRHYRFHVALVLVARQNGKTLVKSVLTLWRMYECDARYVVGTAQDVAQAREVMNETLAPMMLDNPKLRERFDPENDVWERRRGIWRKQPGDEYIRLDSPWVGGRAVAPHGPRYLIKALNRSAGRGLAGVSEVNIDELREQRDYLGWAAISKVVMAAADAQIWCMSNAGDRQSLLLNHLRAVALGGIDETMFHAEWSAENGCELDDPTAWAQANPSLGYGLPEAAIRSALATDPPSVFRTEVLCQFVDAMAAAIDMGAWSDGADRGGSLDGLSALALCVEVAPEGFHITAVVAGELPDGRVRSVRVGAWHDTTAARLGVRELIGLMRPKAVGWFPTGPGAALSATMRKLKATEIKGTAVAEACMTLADYVDGRRLLHSDDELINDHMARTARIGSKGSWMFDRASLEPVDGAFATAGAVHLALNLKRRRPRRGVILPTR